MADDEFDWEKMLLGTDEPLIRDEIEGADEVSLTAKLYKVQSPNADTG
jgi:hypothetical protein